MSFSPQQNRIFVVAIGLLALAGLMIYNSQLDSAKADGAKSATTECAANTNAALLKSAQEALSLIQRQLTDANQAATLLRQQQQATERRNQALQKEIKHVTETWLAPGSTAPQPLPACVFTHGFVRVYNQSIAANPDTAGVSTAASTPGADSPAAAATSVKTSRDLQPSDIDRPDILQHITQYGARCQDIESQLNQLLDYLEKQGTN